MLVTVLKAFPLSLGGAKKQQLAVDDVVDVPDELFDGLFAEKYIDDGVDITAAVAGEITIPEGWADLGLPALKALAASISGQVPTSKTKAVEVIKAELARREAV
jgi:hypothetical protein